MLYAVTEHNDRGALVWSVDFAGAYARAKTASDALKKLPEDCKRYASWLGLSLPDDLCVKEIQSIASNLHIEDADSDVCFDIEREPLPQQRFDMLCTAAIRAAKDFQAVYDMVSCPNDNFAEPRETFYGAIPSTANAVYEHTNLVTSYYLGEVGITHTNVESFVENRLRATDELRKADWQTNGVFVGQYDEKWSVAKVLRRFIWHDTIHAKAIFRRLPHDVTAACVTPPFGFVNMNSVK